MYVQSRILSMSNRDDLSREIFENNFETCSKMRIIFNVTKVRPWQSDIEHHLTVALLLDARLSGRETE